MPKILHLITRLDMGGSVQNTLLVHGLARESGMSAAERRRRVRNPAIKWGWARGWHERRGANSAGL